MSDVLLPSDLEYDGLTKSLDQQGISYKQVSREEFLDELTSGDYSAIIGNNHERMYAATVEYDNNMQIMDLGDSGLATSYLSGNPQADAGSINHLTDLYQQVREANEMEERMDFATSVFKHDALNEINVIMGRLEFAREFADREADEHLEVAENNVYGLKDIVESTEALINNKEREPISLTQLMEDLHDSYHKEAEKRGFDFEIDSEIGVYALAGEDIRNMYGQMIRNGFEHSGGDRIRIAADEVDGRPRVVYEDNGSGIQDERKKQVLKEGVTENDEGGLGMFIMAQTAEEHNMELEVGDSEELGGLKISTMLEPTEQ